MFITNYITSIELQQKSSSTTIVLLASYFKLLLLLFVATLLSKDQQRDNLGVNFIMNVNDRLLLVDYLSIQLQQRYTSQLASLVVALSSLAADSRI